MLKGKTVIELTDVHTGQTEVYEDTNMVTEALMDIFNTNIKIKIVSIINKLFFSLLLYSSHYMF